MRRIAVALVAAMVMALTPNVAHAQEVDVFYGQSAAVVAKEVGCKNFTRTGPALYSKDGGICFVKGQRVNIKTFSSLGQQARWNSTMEMAFGRNFYWANGWGVSFVAKNGSLGAARAGASVINPSKVVHG